jgi:ABC-2 type transport system ATP-binding protein
MSTPAIRTIELTKRFGDVVALDGLDVAVAEKEVVGCLGPNGAGKTTLVRLLHGLLVPTSGRAEVFGMDCHHQTVDVHRRLAYVPGETSLWPSLTGEEALHLLGRVQGHVDVAYREDLLDSFALDPSIRVRTYSGDPARGCRAARRRGSGRAR